MTGESSDVEIHPTDPGSFEDFTMAMDVAAGRSDVGTY